MKVDEGYPAEVLYLRPWAKRDREMKSLALDEASGTVRREFARWVRAGRPSK